MFNFVLTDSNFMVRGENANMRLLRSNEVCVFHVGKKSHLDFHRDLIQTAISKSRKVVFSLDRSEVDRPDVWEAIRSFQGLFGISIKYRLAELKEIVYQGTTLPGREGDLDVVEHFNALIENAKKESWNIKFIPEIEINDHIELLGPTLMALSLQEPPWMILGVDSEPDPERVAALKKCFQYLQIRNFPLIDIHFSFECEWSRTWKMQTENFFSGPEEFHIDLSNKCTHSCVFCALYAPSIINDLKKNNRMDEGMRKFMSAQLDSEKALRTMESLPVTTRLIQFGGAGDPMLHPKAVELISMAREQGIRVEVLSNMEYFKEEDIQKLTSIGGVFYFSLKLVANISAATPETYVLTRPRQTPATFHKVINNVRRFAELRERNNDFGVHMVIMCVLNRLNYHEASLLVDLAKETRSYIWFKPLEIHSRFHAELLPRPEEKAAYKESLLKALKRADKIGVTVFDRPMLEENLVSRGELHL